MDVLRIVYFTLMDFFLFPVLDKVIISMPRSDLQDCFTVEIEEDTTWDGSLKPSLASAMPSNSEWTSDSTSDYDVSLCIDCLKDATRDLVKQPWLDSRYKTLSSIRARI
jgi:hypothetical protein